MKPILPKLISIALLPVCLMSVSCDESCEEPYEENKTYELVSIMWKLDEGDGMEIVEEKLPQVVYTNTGSVEQDVEYKPLEMLEETSYFESEDGDFLNKWIAAGLWVSVPSEFSLLSSEYGYFVGRVEAPLQIEETIQLEPTTDVSYSVKLHPNSKITYNTTLYLKRITATYQVLFGEKDDSFDKVRVTGKWTGIFLNNMENDVVIEEIQ